MELSRKGLARFWVRLAPPVPAAPKVRTVSRLLAGGAVQLETVFQLPLVLPIQVCAAAGMAEAKSAATAAESARRRARVTELRRVFLISFSQKLPVNFPMSCGGGAPLWRRSRRKMPM